MGKDFVHLHMHTEFSLLDGMNRIKELPKRVKELGMKSVAITDHGNMYGVIDFYKECKEQGIKPIIGIEAYIAARGRKDKEPVHDKERSHIILLAKNNVGYKNLIKLVSLSNIEGTYYKPRIDHEIMEEYSEGIICLSACLAGELAKAILKSEEEAEKIANWYKKVYKDNYYIEIQANGLPEQIIANEKLIKLAKKLNIPIVATNDCHYLKKEDAEVHEILLAMQTGKKMSDPDRMKFNSNEFYVKSPEEMWEYFKYIPEALENTLKIAEMCNVDIEFGNTRLPHYDIGKKDHDKYLKELCINAVENKYGKDLEDSKKKEILERLNYELEIISSMGFTDYFLIVWDFIKYAKENGIPVGPGRGSGAGSITAYLLDITDIDPLKYHLLFERFLNPERVTMPDIDVDFCNERRGEVIEYVGKKYGSDHVALIITFGTLAARAVIRDVARVLEYPLYKTDIIAKLVPSAPKMTLEKALNESKELKEKYENDPDVKNILDIAKKFEGLPKNISTHACGVVITDKPVSEYVPLTLNDGNIITQYTMNLLEELGLLKMDFLGLRTLTVIQQAKRIIKKVNNVDIELGKTFDDQKVFELWKTGNTLGVFQFESPGMIKFMKNLCPDTLEDIIAGVSLYRPGPMDQIPRYIEGKKNKENIKYTHESLKPILEVTYGCMVYQEQVIKIVQELAGYSLGRADIVRRAMGKKKLDVMEKERKVFIYGETDEKGNIVIDGAIRRGVDEKSAEKIFDEMFEFAKYAFNKSHAAAYAKISYITAELKAYYPSEFLAAVMNSYLGNLDKIPIYIEDAKSLGINVLSPDINKSFTDFAVVKETKDIIFGLGSIKNMGLNASDIIVEERKKNGNFKSFEDFLERMKGTVLNKRSVESLVKVGAFDSLNIERGKLLASFENLIDIFWKKDSNLLDGQISMFDVLKDDKNKNNYSEELYFNVPEMTLIQKLEYEKEMIGIYVSGHPLKKIWKFLNKIVNYTSKDYKDESKKLKDKQIVRTCGLIEKIEVKTTKKGNALAFISLIDMYGTNEIMLFERTYLKYRQFLTVKNVIGVIGKLNIKDDYITIIGDTISEIKINGINAQKFL